RELRSRGGGAAATRRRPARRPASGPERLRRLRHALLGERLVPRRRPRLEPRRRRLRRRDRGLRRRRLRSEGRAVRGGAARAPRVSRQRIALGFALGLAEAAGAATIVATSDHEPHKAATLAFALTAGVTFIASGLVALRRRPGNRTGLYLAAVGYLWLLGALGDANNDVVYTAGSVLGNLAFPTGGLATRVDRILVRATACFVVIGPTLLLMFANRPPSCTNCRDSSIVVYSSHTLERTIDIVGTMYVVALIVAVGIVLAFRWHRSSTALRRVLLPV